VVDGYVEIQVVDTGKGIPKNLLAKIFAPFVTTKPDGTGATFTLRLPAAES